MSVRSLAVVGHVGPDVREGAMDAPHALAALAALGQPTRLSIFRMLVRNEPDGISAGALAEAVGCPHNTFSTHVAILARAGLVRGTREGRSITYRANAAGTRALIAFLVTDCCDGRPELCGLPGQATTKLPAALLPRNKEETQRQGRTMTWTVTNLFIEIIAGIVGAHAISAAAKEHSFGVIGHTIAGAAGGAFSGYFLQTLAATVVNSTGEVHQDADAVTRLLLQGLMGIAAGAILTMIVGFAKHSIDQHKTEKS